MSPDQTTLDELLKDLRADGASPQGIDDMMRQLELAGRPEPVERQVRLARGSDGTLYRDMGQGFVRLSGEEMNTVRLARERRARGFRLTPIAAAMRRAFAEADANAYESAFDDYAKAGT